MPVYRTTVVLPLPLQSAAKELARELGISFGEFVRRALEKEVTRHQGDGEEHDPLLDDSAVYRGKVPKNLSEDHDAYLYGE